MQDRRYISKKKIFLINSLEFGETCYSYLGSPGTRQPLLLGTGGVPGNPLYCVQRVPSNPSYQVPEGTWSPLLPSTPYSVPDIMFYLVPSITVQFIPGTTW